MPRVVVPDPGRAASKWNRRASNAGQDYVEGAQLTQKSQTANARAARALWTQQMSAPATAERWDKGLQRSGDEGWRMGVRDKGSARYGQGVAASESKYAARAGRILQAIGSVEIPARGLPGSDGNFQRSRLIGQALAKLKGSFTA